MVEASERVSGLRAAAAIRRADGRGGLLWNPAVVWTIRVIVLVVILAAWELYASGVSRSLFAGPSAIVVAFAGLYVEQNVMLPAMFITFGSLIAGFVPAIAVGVTLGVLMGRIRLLERLLTPYIVFFFSIPYIALIPLLVIWFGVEGPLRVVLVFLASLFPILVNTVAGVKEVDPDLVDVAVANRATNWQLIRTVVLPASLPYIFTGVQVALGLALVGVIVAEMTAAITGMGGLLITFANFFRTADMFVVIITLMVIAVALNQLMRVVEQRLLAYRSTDV